MVRHKLVNRSLNCPTLDDKTYHRIAQMYTSPSYDSKMDEIDKLITSATTLKGPTPGIESPQFLQEGI